MRILLAVDGETYSEYAVRQAAKLAVNTWADVTLLTIFSKGLRDKGKPEPTDFELLHRHKELFLESCPYDESPYKETTFEYQLIEIKRGAYEAMQTRRQGKKDLRLRIRMGDLSEEILNEAQDEGHDLIVIGCGKGEKCIWKESKKVPARVVNESKCSVLVVKEDRSIESVLCCLDQSGVSQESMEMINQMAIIHGAKLNIVGLTRDQAIRVDVDKELWRIQDYYLSREIDTHVRLQEISNLETSLHSEATPDLLALWMGKRSLIKKIFPANWAGQLVSTSPCSVLILR